MASTASTSLREPAPLVARPLPLRALEGFAAGAGLATAFAVCLWLVAAAAERPSVLSPPSMHVDAVWLLGPLHGLLPALTSGFARLHYDHDVALALLAVAWLVAWIFADALPQRVVFGAVALCTALFLLSPPQPITDVFNYFGYARMPGLGLNPYRDLPQAAPHDQLFALSNWHHLQSPYGPLFTYAMRPLAALPLATGFWIWKAIVVGSAIGIVEVVRRLAIALGRSPQRAMVLAGLCPLTLAVGVGAFHNDFPPMLAVVSAALLLVRTQASEGESSAGGRAAFAAGLLVVLAAGLKPSFALIVPVLVAAAAPHRRAALLGAASGGIAVGLIVLLAFGGALPDVGTQGRLVTVVSGPNLIGLLAGHGGADAAVRSLARVAVLAVAAIATVVVFRRPRHGLSAITVVLLASLLLLAWVMPWYLSWILPLAAVGRARIWLPALIVLTIALGAGSSSRAPRLYHSLGYYPTRTATGRANHLLTMELVR